MIKQFLTFLLVCSIVQNTSKNLDVIQEIINGIYKELKMFLTLKLSIQSFLSAQSMVRIEDCFDKKDAEKAIEKLEDLFEDIEKGDITKYSKAIKELDDIYQEYVKENIEKCIKEERKEIRDYFDNIFKTDINVINGSLDKDIYLIQQYQVVSFIIADYEKLKKESQKLIRHWKLNQYQAFGSDFVQLTKMMFSKTLVPIQFDSEKTAREKNYKILKGIFKENDLDKPEELMDNCGSDELHQQIFEYLDYVLDTISEEDVKDVQILIEDIFDNIKKLPEEFIQCLLMDEDFRDLLKEYDIEDKDDFKDFEDKTNSYLLLHFGDFRDDIEDAHKEIKDEKYSTAGKILAKLAVDIKEEGHVYSSTPTRVANQKFLNGVFKMNQIERPASIADCADAKVHKQIFSYISTFIHEMAKAKIHEASQVLTKLGSYIDGLPQKTQKCFNQNEEVMKIKQKYGINSYTDEIIFKHKLAAYMLFNMEQTQQWFKQAEETWFRAQYLNTGFQFAYWIHEVLQATALKI